MIKINKSIEYTTETQKMSLNIPDNILNIIGEFASLSIETKKYKRLSLANKMKITKIDHKCFFCNCKVKLQSTRDPYKYASRFYKNHFVCYECLYFSNCNTSEKKNSIEYTNIYGFHWKPHYLLNKITTQIKLSALDNFDFVVLEFPPAQKIARIVQNRPQDRFFMI